MLEEHRRLQLPTLNSGPLEFEVGFSNQKDVKEGQIIRLWVGKDFYDFRQTDLANILLVVGDAMTQKKLLPMKVRGVKKMERMLHARFKCTKPYAKGDEIEVKFPWIDEVPTEEEMYTGNWSKDRWSGKKIFGSRKK